jgi:hypothetical protein
MPNTTHTQKLLFHRQYKQTYYNHSDDFIFRSVTTEDFDNKAELIRPSFTSKIF